MSLIQNEKAETFKDAAWYSPDGILDRDNFDSDLIDYEMWREGRYEEEIEE